MSRFTGGNSLTWGLMFWRLVQMVLAITVIGLYAQDLNRANKEHKYNDGKWVYAVVVGSLSSVTALVWLVLLFLASAQAMATLFAWDLILFVLWAAVFGIFGKMYIGEKVEMESGIERMKNAVWVDLTNMLLWFFSAVWGVTQFFFGSERRSLHTGRAKK